MLFDYDVLYGLVVLYIFQSHVEDVVDFHLVVDCAFCPAECEMLESGGFPHASRS